MGLTIHFNVSLPTSENIVEKLHNIRQKCLDLPFEEVSEVKDIIISKKTIERFRYLQKIYSYPQNTEENLAKRDKEMEERGVDTWTIITVDDTKNPQSHHLVQLNLWAGEGCEGTNLIFSKKRKYWRCRGFTKTQYAEQFVKCHLLVIKLMDILKEQGFKVKVRDEGHYCETRDLKVLAENINDYTTMLKNVFGALSSQLESRKDIEIMAPIEGCENYINVKDE